MKHTPQQGVTGGWRAAALAAMLGLAGAGSVLAQPAGGAAADAPSPAPFAASAITPGAPATADTPPAAGRNVYAAGGRVHTATPVAGDYVAFGGRIVVAHPVRGDATLAGGAVDVRAPVGDDLRVAGGDVSVDSTVAGELFAAGGNVTLGPASRAAGGARLRGSNLVLEGRIEGPLDAAAQHITVNGTVEGDARLAAQQVELGPAARISGTLHYTSASELKRASGATVGGAVTREPPRDDRERADDVRDGQQGARGAGWGAGPQGMHGGYGMHTRGPGWWGGVFTFLALMAAATVFLWLFPVYAAGAVDRMRSSPGLALGLGVAVLLAVPLLTVLLFITLLGIPLALLIMSLYPAVLLVGGLIGVLFIARAAQGAMRRPPASSLAATLGYFALALLLLLLIGQLPWVGGLVLLLVTVAGLGGGVLELHRLRQASRGAPPPPGAAAGSAPGPGTGLATST